MTTIWAIDDCAHQFISRIRTSTTALPYRPALCELYLCSLDIIILMFELRKSFTFEASHQLIHHDGKCSNLHGHSYTLTVELCSPTLGGHGPKHNMVIDFSDVSAPVRKLVKTHLDHKHLNDSLNTESPTAEYIAYWCFHQLLPDLPLLTAVEIRETSSASVVYRPQQPSQRAQNGCVAGAEHSHSQRIANRSHGLRFPGSYASSCRHCTSCPNCRNCAYRFENSVQEIRSIEQKCAAQMNLTPNGHINGRPPLEESSDDADIVKEQENLKSEVTNGT